MITRAEIEYNLKRLERDYNAAKNAKSRTLYSKLAVLELCGWIEENFDTIATVGVKASLRTNDYKDYFKNEIIKSNNGFSYHNHFKKMMVKSVGVIRMEKIELKMQQVGSLNPLKGKLSSLEVVRNSLAHTHSTQHANVQTPSVTLSDLQQILPHIIKLDEISRVYK